MEAVSFGEKIFRVYLYFNVNLFSSKEDKYNLPIILKGAGKNIAITAGSYLKAAWCLGRFLCSVPFSEFFFRAGYSLGDWSIRESGG